jgi:uncharacterized protein YggE
MPPTSINIQGRAKLHKLAERAKLGISVSSSEYTQTEASKNVIEAINAIQTLLDQSLCPRLENGDISAEATVSFYSIGSLTTSNDDEYDDDHNKTGKRLYSATCSLDIRFRNFKGLGEAVVKWASEPYVSLQGIEWLLTEQSQTTLEEQAKLEALRHAIKRAQGYADVIGRRSVTPVKIEDTQYMFGEARIMQATRKMASSASFGIGVGLDFEPQQVEVNATLDVEFHAE